MRRPLLSNIRIITVALTVVVLITLSSSYLGAYCSFKVGYSSPENYCMAINLVKFDGNVIQKWDVPRDGSNNIITGVTPNYYRYKDIDKTNQIMLGQKDKSYVLEIYAGATSLAYDANNSISEYAYFASYYGQDFKVYIDYNQNNNFESTELAGSFNPSGASYPGKITITIPKTAVSGKTTMRIVCDYWAMDYGDGGFDACNSYYGEARDYTFEIKGNNDAGIVNFTSPTSPLSAGIQPVKAILKNYDTGGNLTKCTISWSVDGVAQTPINWVGNLTPSAQVELTLGTYNFKSKGPKTTYSLTAVTSSPNGDLDANPNNDAAPSYVLSMPVVPGIYYVGGTGYDFQTLKEATDIINVSGITGNGDVVLRIRPGTYTGPFVMDNFKHGVNNFIFEADPANPGNVSVIASTTSTSNYVWYINNIPNVTIRNLAFSVTNPSGYGGRIFMIRGNADNDVFESNTFNGLSAYQQAWFTYSMIDCQASPMNNQKYITNTFNNGFMSMVLVNSTRNSKGLLIQENRFNSFTNRAIQVEGISDGIITKNTLGASTTASFSGIVVYNGTDVTENSISGIIGINTTCSGITVVHDAVSAPAKISGNSVTSCSGINGITATGLKGGEINKNTIQLSNSNLTSAISGVILSNSTVLPDRVVIGRNSLIVENGMGVAVSNYNADVVKNKFNIVLASSKVILKGITESNSSGMILMNDIVTAGQAMELLNSSSTVAYNSTSALGTNDVFTVNSGSNKFYRNQFVNNGSGKVFVITNKGTNVFNQNNYYSVNPTIGTIEGTPYTNGSQLLTMDNNGINTNPNYKAINILRIAEYKDKLAFFTPLPNMNWPNGYQKAYEDTTIDGFFRDAVYYVGAYNIFPVVTILANTKEIIECSGAEDQMLIIAGTTTEGKEPYYQWYKDGIPLPGETGHIYKFKTFDYTVSGIYTCNAMCPGAKTKITKGIPVYALTAPAIVEQPKEIINAQLGNSYSFDVKVHYRGLVPPYYKDYFQWYKYDATIKDTLAIKDGDRFAGTESSLLTIKDLQATDICKPGDFYFIKVEGQCGTVYSDPFIISETPEVVFRDQPMDMNSCPKSDVVFTANAVAPAGFTVTYKWMKDGLDLFDGTKYNGVYTNKLQVFNLDANDEGDYVCEATIPEVSVSKMSNAGKIVLKDIPEGKIVGTSAISTKRGNDVTMTVTLVKGFEPITVKWYYKDELLKEGVWDKYVGALLLKILLENVNENQSGDYKCVLENECDKTEMVFNLTVTKWDEASSVEVISENGYALYANYPNPAKGMTTIKFEMPQTDNAVITLVDQTGRTVSELFNGIANKGMNALVIDTEHLNVSNGAYFYMISAKGFNASLPMIIVK